jgi:hypothetical protein
MRLRTYPVLPQHRCIFVCQPSAVFIVIHALSLLAFFQLFAHQTNLHGFHPRLPNVIVTLLEFGWWEKVRQISMYSVTKEILTFDFSSPGLSSHCGCGTVLFCLRKVVESCLDGLWPSPKSIPSYNRHPSTSRAAIFTPCIFSNRTFFTIPCILILRINQQHISPNVWILRLSTMDESHAYLNWDFN